MMDAIPATTRRCEATDRSEKPPLPTRFRSSNEWYLSRLPGSRPRMRIRAQWTASPSAVLETQGAPT